MNMLGHDETNDLLEQQKCRQCKVCTHNTSTAKHSHEVRRRGMFEGIPVDDLIGLMMCFAVLMPPLLAFAFLMIVVGPTG